jgi:hypothetical protein
MRELSSTERIAISGVFQKIMINNNVDVQVSCYMLWNSKICIKLPGQPNCIGSLN